MSKRNTKSSKSTSSKPTTAATSAAATSAARSRARDRRRERQQEKNRQRQIAYLVGGVALAVIAVVLFIIVNQPASAPIPQEALDRYVGIPQGTTDAGFPLLGSPNAPVLVKEFSSFSCPGCAQFHQRWSDNLVEWVREGIISFAYVPLTTGSIPNALGATKAALCAGEQSAFFEFHDALFNWHVTYGNQAFSQNRLTTGAENLGLSMSQYNSCMNSSRGDNVVRTAQNLGVPSTPTIRVNGTVLEPAQVENLGDVIQQAFVATGLPAVPIAPPGDAEAEIAPDLTEDDTTPEAEVEIIETDVAEDIEAEAEGEDTDAEDAEATNTDDEEAEAEGEEDSE